MKNRPYLRIIACILLLSSISLACTFDEKEAAISSNSGFYTFDPDTILESINQGNTDIFSIQLIDPDEFYDTGKTVQWTQSDYLKILDAFFTLELKDGWQLWNPAFLIFSMNCGQVDLGPQELHAKFVDWIPNGDRESRIERDVSIRPNDGAIYWSDLVYFPSLREWQTYLMLNVELTAEDALRIAEENLGSAYRADKKNNCDLNIELSRFPKEFEPDWIVSYYSDTDGGISHSTDIYIDVETGEFVLDGNR